MKMQLRSCVQLYYLKKTAEKHPRSCQTILVYATWLGESSQKMNNNFVHIYERTEDPYYKVAALSILQV